MESQQFETLLEEVQKELSTQSGDIKKIQSDLTEQRTKSSFLEKRINDDLNDLKNKKLNSLELAVKQLQEDLKNAKHEIDSLKHNKPEYNRPVNFRSSSQALAEKEKQSLEQKYEALVHEKQDMESKFKVALENSQSENEKHIKKEATYTKQIEELQEQLKRKETILVAKLQSAGNDEVAKLKLALSKNENQHKLLLQEKKDVEAKLQETLNEYKQKIDILEQTNSEVAKKMKEQEHEIDALKQQQKYEIDTLKQQKEHEINVLKQQLEQIKIEKEQLKYGKISDIFASQPDKKTVYSRDTTKSNWLITKPNSQVDVVSSLESHTVLLKNEESIEPYSENDIQALHLPSNSLDHNRNPLQSVKVYEVPKAKEEPKISKLLKDHQPTGNSSNTGIKPVDNKVEETPSEVCTYITENL